MLPISAAELASIQADVAAAALDKTCAIQRLPTSTPDNRGVPSGNYSAIYTVQAGMRQPTGTHLTNYDYLIAGMDTWLVQFPVGTDVRSQDHLAIEGRSLVVQVILAPQSYPALLSVLASEVRSGS